MIHFLNAVTGLAGDDAITDVVIMNTYKDICNEAERWLYFFKQAENQDIENLPEPLKTEEMIQAISSVRLVSCI